jgi:DHA2 family multidrug resistance protein-like MFS transporter
MASISMPVFRARADTARLTPAQTLAIVSGGYLLASWAMNPVSAILPTITADLNIDMTRAGWLMNAYFVFLVSWVLIAGRLGDAFGHGTVFRAGCVVFTLGSLVAAVGDSFAAVLVARGVQGLGSAMLFGTSLAIIATVYHGSRLAWAVGILTVSAGVSSLVGVWISTTLIQFTSWHVTFFVPVIIGLVVSLMGGGLPSVRRTEFSHIDWLGGVLLLGALGFLLVGLNHLHDGPETFEAGAPYHLSMHLAALAFFVLFLWRQVTARRPLIQLRLFRGARLTTGVIANGIAHSSMLATGLLLPFLLERGQGYTPNETQQVSLVMTFSLIVGSLAGGYLFARTGSSIIGVGSIAAIAGGLSVMGWIGADLPYLGMFPVVAVLGAGLGVFTAVNNTSVMTSVGADQRGFASGLVETTRQLGHSLGVSISSGVLQASLAAATVPMLGYRAGFSEAATVMGLVAAAGVLVVLYPQLSRATLRR